MNEAEILRIAKKLRATHEAYAADEAGRRADELLHAGDLAGFKTWVRVMAAVDELDKKTPRLGRKISPTLQAIILDEVAHLLARYLPPDKGLSKAEWVAKIRAALES